MYELVNSVAACGVFSFLVAIVLFACLPLADTCKPLQNILEKALATNLVVLAACVVVAFAASVLA